ncbi:uncharacterized protein LOC121837302 [Ixodes scapularis]|uniref:uncharacterized protein LOC121837302 n=1 Tax=Ixodes scapularis TaxID=6945 RepID=UPI001C3869FC|nr:uncharacterized protein LOC121837302 [Ixodes scapularis]
MLGPAPSCRPREQTVAQSRTDNRILPFQTSGEAAAALSASGMVSCVVVGCHNKTQSSKKKKECKVADARFFKIPKVRTRECDTTRTLSARRQREWLKRINRKDLDADLDKYKVCSRHFVSGAAADLFDDCNPDWAPSQHLGYASTLDGPHSGRYVRLSRRRHQESMITLSAFAAFIAGSWTHPLVR